MKTKQHNLFWKLSLGLVCLLFVLMTAFGFTSLRTPKQVKAVSETASVYMLEGAAIRYDGENSGIRFTAYVSDTLFEKDALKSGVSVGMDITATDSNGADKTWNVTTENNSGWKWATSDVDGYRKLQVALVGFPETEYGTELTAEAWVNDNGAKTPAMAQTRSIARVANACLAENELLKKMDSEKTLTDGKVGILDGYTAGEALANVSSIEMNNNTFAWGEVTNATGYFVGFSGKVAHVIGGETVPVSAFGRIETPVDGVSVIAYGNGVDNTYGEVVCNNVFTSVLADFSDANNGSLVNISGYQWSDYKVTPVYENGTATAGFYLDRYHADGGSTNLAAFKVVLPTGLDLTKEGIAVKVLLASFSNLSSNGNNPDKFTMLTKGGQKTWQSTTDITTFPNVTMPTDKTTYMELKVSSEQLVVLGYVEGDTELYFGGWYTATVQKNLGTNMTFTMDEISYYTQPVLSTPTNVTVSDEGLVEWNGDVNADGYTVEIDGAEYETTTTSYQMEEFTKDVTVRVQAISNGEAWETSAWSEEITTNCFTLADFSDVNNGTLVNISGYQWSNYKVAPVYENGTATAGFYIDRWHSDGGSTKLAAFKVGLPTGLDLTKAGIVVKALLADYSNISGGTDLFTLLTKDGQKSWQNKASTDFPGVTLITDKTTYMELKVSSSQLTELGYVNGDTELYFGGWYVTGAQKNSGVSMKFTFDEIGYYAEPTLLTPTNLTVNDTGLIEWTAVKNADGYVVEIDGTEYTSDTNSYQIQGFAKDVTVRIRAVSDGEYWKPSPWTEEVTTDCFTLADFSDENNGTMSGLAGYVKGETYRDAPFYEDGSVKAGFYPDRYHANGGSTSLAAFKIILPKGLDLNKDGIVVKVQLYDKSSAVTPDKFTLLTKDGQKTWQNGSSADFPGVTMTYQQWLEVKFSSAELDALGYKTGDTVLYFGGWIASINAGLGTGLWFEFDEIGYYADYSASELAKAISYNERKQMEVGAYIAPSSSVLMNADGTEYEANNIYQSAGFHSFNIVVMPSSKLSDVEQALGRCQLAGLDAYIQLHNKMTKNVDGVDGWTKFQEIFSGIDFTDYPALKGFFVVDEPSWTQMEYIANYYVPWFNENYAKSDLEFCVNLLGGYSSAIGALRDINGNLLGDGNVYQGTEAQYRDCHTAYLNKWLDIFATVKSSNKCLSLDSYPLMDNQTGLLTEFDGGNLPEGYERVLYADWLRRSMNMANSARDNGYTFGAFIQTFDEGGEDSTRTYRLPTKVEEIKWQAYMNIALGAKRLTYFGFNAFAGGHYMTEIVDGGLVPTYLHTLVAETNAELATLDHVFVAFDTWVGAKTFIPSGATASTAIAGVADIELDALTGVSSLTTSGELVVGEMVDGHGNRGYMLVGYNDPFDGVETGVEMSFDGADGFIIYRAGEQVRTFVESVDGLLSLSLGAGEGVFVIPVYAK